MDSLQNFAPFHSEKASDVPEGGASRKNGASDATVGPSASSVSSTEEPDDDALWETGWEHVKVSDAAEWHTRPPLPRVAFSEPNDLAGLQAGGGSGNGGGGFSSDGGGVSSADTTKTRMPTVSSAPNLFRRAERLTTETFESNVQAAARFLLADDAPLSAGTMAPAAVAPAVASAPASAAGSEVPSVGCSPSSVSSKGTVGTDGSAAAAAGKEAPMGTAAATGGAAFFSGAAVAAAAAPGSNVSSPRGRGSKSGTPAGGASPRWQFRIPRSQSLHAVDSMGGISGALVSGRHFSQRVARGMTQAEFAVRCEGKLLVAMVGLPARGKTYIAQRIMRHMEWNEMTTRLFNAGNYRRFLVGAHTPASFFDPANPEGAALREKCADLALQDALTALSSEGEKLVVAIFDATNTTRGRRAWIRETVERHSVASGGKVQLVFLETMLTDDAQVWKNVRDAKLKSPDYAGMDPDAAMADFTERIVRYKSVYEPVSRDEDVPFIRLTDAGEELLSYRAGTSRLAGRVVSLMSVMRLRLQPILLTRCGESDNEAQGRLGGDTLLTVVGQLFASRLPEVVARHAAADPIVWTSSKMRARQTAESLGAAGRWPVLELAALDDIDTGLATGLTYAEYAQQFKDSYIERRVDKLRSKFPNGESYMDVFRRLEPLLLDLLAEQRPVVVVAHLGVLRVMYAYLTGVPPAECVNLHIPMHCVLQLNPKGYGYEEWRHYPLR